MTFRLPPLLLCGSLFCIAMWFRSPVPEFAIGTAGTYLVLWMALGLRSKILQKINNSYDFSYGVYLYAWPLASLFMLTAQRLALDLSPLELTSATCVLATFAAAASWYLIERPALNLKSRLFALPPARVSAHVTTDEFGLPIRETE